MKYIALIVIVLFAVPCSAFEGGYGTQLPFTTAELPKGGKHVKPTQEGALHFYLAQAFEVYEEDEKMVLSSPKRSRRFASSGLFHSTDGEEWHLAGHKLHFTSVWTHPKTGHYFGTVAGISHKMGKGMLLKYVVYHVVSSEDGITWISIQGDLKSEENDNEVQPTFMVDPEHGERVCLYYHGRDRGGFRWSIAQSKTDVYDKWRLFNSRTWPHESPRDQ